MLKTYVTLLAITLFFSASQAEEIVSCPDISGKYTCVSSNESLNLEIIQNENEFIMNVGNGPIDFIVNGEKHTIIHQKGKGSGTFTYTTCHSGSVAAFKKVQTSIGLDQKEIASVFIFVPTDSNNLVFATSTKFTVNNEVSKPIENHLTCHKN